MTLHAQFGNAEIPHNQHCQVGRSELTGVLASPGQWQWFELASLSITKQVLRYWLCSSLLASLSITKTSFALELTHVDAENSFIDWPAHARPAAALRPVLPGSQPRARELVPRPEYGRLAVAVANELQHNS